MTTLINAKEKRCFLLKGVLTFRVAELGVYNITETFLTKLPIFGNLRVK